MHVVPLASCSSLFLQSRELWFYFFFLIHFLVSTVWLVFGVSLVDTIDFLLSLAFSFSNSIRIFHKPVSISLALITVVSLHVIIALVRCSWHVQPSLVSCATKIKLDFMSDMTDAVLVLSDNRRLMFIYFVAVESIVDVFLQLICIGLCFIGLPGHVVVMKWLAAAIYRYLVVGPFIISCSSRNVTSVFFEHYFIFHCSLLTLLDVFYTKEVYFVQLIQ